MANYEIPKIAICYDFDKTLSPKNMQDFGFIKKLEIKEDDFWDRCSITSNSSVADRILVYMLEMKKAYEERNFEITKDTLFELGKTVQFFDGVEEWFERISNYGKEMGVEIEHYILSSGLRQIILGTPIAKYFKEIFACEYIYDENGIPIWPSTAVNYTNKTQFLYRINKGILNILDDSVNEQMDHDLRPIPFSQMIYIGDSQTDIPCMRLVMKNDGVAIGVYGPEMTNKKYLNVLIRANKINYVMEADYKEDSALDNLVKNIIKKIKYTNNLKLLNKKQKESED